MSFLTTLGLGASFDGFEPEEYQDKGLSFSDKWDGDTTASGFGLQTSSVFEGQQAEGEVNAGDRNSERYVYADHLGQFQAPVKVVAYKIIENTDEDGGFQFPVRPGENLDVLSLETLKQEARIASQDWDARNFLTDEDGRVSMPTSAGDVLRFSFVFREDLSMDAKIENLRTSDTVTLSVVDSNHSVNHTTGYFGIRNYDEDFFVDSISIKEGVTDLSTSIE